MNASGRVDLVTGANDNGSGPLATGIRQIVAELLGISVFSIDVPALDTAASGYDGGSQGSRTTQVTGEAARRAALELRSQLARAVASQLGATVEQLTFSEGQIVNAEQSHLMQITEALYQTDFRTGYVCLK
jgi:CO/xanthine dehydrogenase Mo-binding subunit